VSAADSDEQRVSVTDWDALHDRLGAVETDLRALSAGHEYLASQIAEITISQRRADVQQQEQAVRMDEMQAALQANTDLTQRTLQATEAVRDVVTTARIGGRFVRWLTPTLVALGVGVGTIKGWWLASVEWLTK
jgi:hypothetical protein